MASFKIYEKKDKATKKGIPLMFVIYDKGKTYKLKTGLHCKPYSWKQEAQMVDGKKDSKAAVINNKLKKASITLQEVIDAGEFDIKRIRRVFEKPNEDVKHESDETFHDVIDRIIHDHRNEWSKGYQKRFRSIRTKILGFEPTFNPSILTEKFWRKYVDHCIDDLENVSNTINTDSKTFCALIKELRKEGYTFEKDIEEKISWRYIEPHKLGLSWDKVLKIAKLDLSNYPSDTIRDSQKLWLVGAFTGRRWEEVSGMTSTNFYQRKGKWRYRNIGKGQITVDIPLLKEAADYLSKIKFKIPKLTGQQVNRDIKDICRVAGFKDEIQVITPISKNRVEKKNVKEYKTVTFHTGRHSYGQRIAELAANIPHGDKFISFMLGHASPQTSWKYRNLTESSNDKIAEDLGI